MMDGKGKRRQLLTSYLQGPLRKSHFITSHYIHETTFL